MSERETPNDTDAPLTGPPQGEAAPTRLRADPPRVTRLSRKVLAGAGLIAALCIGGALIYAVQKRAAGPAGEELYSTANRRTADGLAACRATIPVRCSARRCPAISAAPFWMPKIAASQSRSRFPSRRPSTPPSSAAAPKTKPPARAASSSREKAVRPRAARRPRARPVPVPALPVRPVRQPQDRQLAFLNAGVDRRTVSPDRVAPPASPYVLQAGAVIPAALITGIRSDLPGQISAQVTEPVYDSPTGRVLLVPQGARLIGEYSADVGFGQRRVLLVWKRLIFPNGRSIVLERQPGADAQGYAGLQDGVDYHWWDLAKAAGLSTLLSVGAELAIDDQDRLLRALRNGGQDTINDAGQQIIRRQLTVAPTLTIRPGFPVRVLVTRDLVLEPYRG
jgi:type IV secretion system protein TrbI